MKILLLSHSFSPDIGGIETISDILAHQFVAAGHEVRVMTWSVGNLSLPAAFQVIRRPDPVMTFAQVRWSDVVFENNPCFRMSWPALFLFKPTVIALHTWIARPSGNLSWVDRLKKLKLVTARSVIAVSEIMRAEIFSYAIVIPNPFKAEIFAVANESVRTADFVFLGRLVSDKGVDLAISAIARLKAENISCTLTIIGGGEELERLTEQTLLLDVAERVVFSGSLSGQLLAAELRRHKFMLIPSRWKEPFGVVALEGLACGCIPIVADGGGLPDAIGKAGLVFKRGDLNDLVAKMKQLLTDQVLEITLRAEAKEHIASHQPEPIAKRYLDIITNAA